MGPLSVLNAPFKRTAGLLTERLNRRERTHRTLIVRGAIVAVVFVSLLAIAGYFLNKALVSVPYAEGVAAILLLPFLGQKQLWASLLTKKEAESTQTHAQNQQRAIKIITAFAARFLPAATLFAFAGFITLVPFIFLRSFLENEEGTAIKDGPFFSTTRLLYTGLALPGLLLACSFLILARIFMPHTQLNPFKGLSGKRGTVAPTYYYPVQIVAVGLDLSFKLPVLCYKKRALTESHVWTGKANATARPGKSEVKRVWVMVLVAYGASYMAGLMVFTFFALKLA